MWTGKEVDVLCTIIHFSGETEPLQLPGLTASETIANELFFENFCYSLSYEGRIKINDSRPITNYVRVQYAQ
jgi:hypothetical protein